MKLTAACAFGLEALLKRELIALGYEARVSQPGRVVFEGDWEAVCRSNIWLRTADRVLIEVQQFEAPDFDALFDTVKDFDWSQFIPEDASFPVIGRSRLSQLSSVPAIQRSVKRAVVESLKRFHGVEVLPETGATYKIEIALLNDIATLTIDSTGPSLHKRGYRKLAAEAPIKETLAAAMVDLSVWNPERPLIDPFCGSGTIPIEAALIGLNMAPGMNRQFSSSLWNTFPSQLWSAAIDEANDLRRRDVTLQIIGTDRDEEVLSLARYHSQQAGVADQIHFQQKSFDELRSKREFGCVITNPPYGERLEEQKRLIGLYESIPAVMQRLPTWSLFLITNMPQFESLIQKKATRRRKLFNGRLECTYYQFLGPRPPRQKPSPTEAELRPEPEVLIKVTPQATVSSSEDPKATDPATSRSIPMVVVNQAKPAPVEIDLTPKVNEPVPDAHPRAESTKTPPVMADLETSAEPAVAKTSKPNSRANEAPLFGGLQSKDHEQAEIFSNRISKRAKHLRRWPTKRGITCFRLYERDIPEIPLVVDRYEDYLHITEYERPHERDLARHAAWLELMKKTAAATLDLPISHVFLKRRRRDNDTRQYEKIDSMGKLIPVHENGLTFLVNLSDYVDTGLFLDHRLTRQMVFDEATDKDFLNLFAYTGSFSVYAAAAGARSTTTVDLSRNYLDWASENFKANELSGPAHRFIASDSIGFLESAARDPRQRFDLAVVDPPTFSNSKRTESDWDVQSRHVELLSGVRSVMRPDGIVYFSTNFRRFKFHEHELPGFDCREISKQTVPEDFRNRRIHRCWRMVCKP